MTTFEAKDEFRLLILEHLQALIFAAELLEPEVKFHVKREWAFDFAIPHLWLAFEYEGRGKGHLTWKHYAKDCEKYTWAAILGWTVVRITPNMVQDGRAGPLIRTAIDVALDPDFAIPFRRVPRETP